MDEDRPLSGKEVIELSGLPRGTWWKLELVSEQDPRRGEGIVSTDTYEIDALYGIQRAASAWRAARIEVVNGSLPKMPSLFATLADAEAKLAAAVAEYEKEKAG